jgi:hypothetical protein
VSDWVAHGLSLPQYEAAFRGQGVTPLDFPLLVEGGGGLLELELGVRHPRGALLGADGAQSGGGERVYGTTGPVS